MTNSSMHAYITLDLQISEMPTSLLATGDFSGVVILWDVEAYFETPLVRHTTIFQASSSPIRAIEIGKEGTSFCLADYSGAILFYSIGSIDKCGSISKDDGLNLKCTVGANDDTNGEDVIVDELDIDNLSKTSCHNYRNCSRVIMKTRQLMMDTLGCYSTISWKHDKKRCEGNLFLYDQQRCSAMDMVLDDSVLTVLSAPSKEDPRATGLHSHRSQVTVCAVAVTRRVIFTGGQSASVYAWDLATNTCVGVVETPTRNATALALIECSAVAEGDHDNSMSSAVIWLFTGHQSGQVHMHRLGCKGPVLEAISVHTTSYTPMAVTDILLSSTASYAVLFFARVCMVLHDCLTNLPVMEFNFEQPLHSVSRPLCVSSPKAAHGEREVLLVALHSAGVCKIVDFLMDGKVLITILTGGKSSPVIGSVVFYRPPAPSNLVPTILKSCKDGTKYVPGVSGLCGLLIKQNDAYFPLSSFPAVFSFGNSTDGGQSREMGLCPVDLGGVTARLDKRSDVDDIALGLEVTLMDEDPDDIWCVCALWTMRNMHFFCTRPSFSSLNKAKCQLLQTYTIPSKRIRYVFGRVLGYSKSAVGDVSETVLEAVLALSDGTMQTVALALSDGTVQTVALDVAASPVHAGNTNESDSVSP